MDTNLYQPQGYYDEMFTNEGECRSHYCDFLKILKKTSSKKMQHLQHSANKTQVAMGMTFNVYHDNQGVEKNSAFGYCAKNHRPCGMEAIRSGIEAADLCPESVYT